MMIATDDNQLFLSFGECVMVFSVFEDETDLAYPLMWLYIYPLLELFQEPLFQNPRLDDIESRIFTVNLGNQAKE